VLQGSYVWLSRIMHVETNLLNHIRYCRASYKL
jgi:hypothetical protein